MLTPKDLANSARKSGYTHVGYNVSPGQTAPKPFQAYDPRSGGPTKKHRWKGPRRATATLAAQDYCDYVNGGGAMPVIAPALKTAGHQRPQRPARPVCPKRQEAYRLLREARAEEADENGYVYCVGEVGYRNAVKVGFSTDPFYRLGTLQTGNPRKLVLLGYIDGRRSDESALHAEFIKDNILQEWFRPTAELLSRFEIEWGEFLLATKPANI